MKVKNILCADHANKKGADKNPVTLASKEGPLSGRT